jgi:hypothetical protein
VPGHASPTVKMSQNPTNSVGSSVVELCEPRRVRPKYNAHLLVTSLAKRLNQAVLQWMSRPTRGQARLYDAHFTICGDADGWVCPNGQTVPPSAGYLKGPQVTKGLLPVWPRLRRGTFTPATLRGPAAIRHPWPGAALAASMPLGPLHATCVQPAPKSRFVVSGLLRYEDQKPERALRCEIQHLNR